MATEELGDGYGWKVALRAVMDLREAQETIERLELKCEQYVKQLEDGWAAIIAVQNDEAVKQKMQRALEESQREALREEPGDGENRD